jgi:hypothetical protein
MLTRLRYISKFAHAISSAELEELVESSASKNKERDITGVLMATGELFFQIIEGPSEEVDQLWSEIIHDERHKDILLLDMEKGELTRMFPDWSMAKVDLSNEAVNRLATLRSIMRAVHAQLHVTQSLRTALEQAMWFELNELNH